MKPNTLGSKVQTKPEKPIRPVSTLTSNKPPLNSRVFELPPMTAIFKEMGQFLQLQHVSTLKPYPCKFMPLASFSHPDFNPLPKVYTIRAFSGSPRLTAPLKFPLLQSLPTTRPRLVCKTNGSELELGKPGERRKPEKRVNGVFWIILLNLGIYVADLVSGSIFLATFFFLYIFGKLVEEEEGNFALWLVLPRNAVSIGASGAVFGLFAISVLVEMCWDWRKILVVLILGQFVIEKVMEAAQASTGLSGSSYSLQSVNHIAHLSGALIGVLLVWLLSKIPSQPPDKRNTKFP